jgi:hypothetical protein
MKLIYFIFLFYIFYLNSNSIIDFIFLQNLFELLNFSEVWILIQKDLD